MKRMFKISIIRIDDSPPKIYVNIPLKKVEPPILKLLSDLQAYSTAQDLTDTLTCWGQQQFDWRTHCSAAEISHVVHI